MNTDKIINTEASDTPDIRGMFEASIVPTAKQLEKAWHADAVYLHHVASHRGYASRKWEPKVEVYRGRFGKGYRVFYPRWDTTRFVYVYYYILRD